MAMFNILAFILLICVFWAYPVVSLKDVTMERYDKWMIEYGRAYASAEEKLKRYDVFKRNVNFIEASNAASEHTYNLSVNQYADLTNEEFLATYVGFTNITGGKSSTQFKYDNLTSVPSSIDWRALGAVTAVKNQDQCGSCWAFSAVAAIEGITQIRTGTLQSLSEQELVDCDSNNNGCNGGDMDYAFKFVIKNGGVTTESDYPYTAVQGACITRKLPNHAATISGYQDVPRNNEVLLMNAVANQPVSVGIDASGYSFQFYKSGIFTGPCGTNLNHGVTIVGYGVDGSTTNYWIVKNSWGASWGAGGYILMKKDINEQRGLCGIAMMASYPTK